MRNRKHSTNAQIECGPSHFGSSGEPNSGVPKGAEEAICPGRHFERGGKKGKKKKGKKGKRRKKFGEACNYSKLKWNILAAEPLYT